MTGGNYDGAGFLRAAPVGCGVEGGVEMSKKWFFKRGNARVSWETLPEWAQWIAVDKNGRVYQYQSRPSIDNTQGAWIIAHLLDKWGMCAAVGAVCDDWRALIFERPPPFIHLLLGDIHTDFSASFEVRTPCKPLVSAEEWAAIRLLLPGAQSVAKDLSGLVYAFCEAPVPLTYNWQALSCMRVPVLEDRFADIPWRESLVEYDGDA